MKAKQLIGQIRRSDETRAVFFIDGEWKTMKADGDKLNLMLETNGNDCMGVYAPGCPEVYLESDIDFMLARKR